MSYAAVFTVGDAWPLLVKVAEDTYEVDLDSPLKPLALIGLFSMLVLMLDVVERWRNTSVAGVKDSALL